MIPTATPSNVMSRITQRLTALESKLAELASASGTLASTIYKGNLRIIQGASLVVEDGGGITVTENGYITTFGGAIRSIDDVTYEVVAYFGKLVSGGADFGTGLLTASNTGSTYFWVAERVGSLLKEFAFLGNTARIDATDNITLNTPSLRLYGLPTTGSAANVRLETSGGIPVLQFVTSSRRYKEDIADAVVDPAEVLQLQGRTWVDKGTADRMAEEGVEADLPRNVGFIAEELDELPSLRQFVDYDDQGRPDAIQYDRVTVALLEVIKTQAQQIADLTTRLETLEGTS